MGPHASKARPARAGYLRPTQAEAGVLLQSVPPCSPTRADPNLPGGGRCVTPT